MAESKRDEGISRKALWTAAISLAVVVVGVWLAWVSSQTVANANDNTGQDEKIQGIDKALGKIDAGIQELLRRTQDIKNEQASTNLKLVNLRENLEKHENLDEKRDDKAEVRIRDLEKEQRVP